MSEPSKKGDLVLALVTCAPQLEVALGGSGLQPSSTIRLAGPTRRSTLILAAVDLLVEDAGVTPADIGRITVTRGPGSFTGIRSGLATAQGLAVALDRPITALDSLLVQAARTSIEVSTVWAAQPGRRGQVYARRFLLNPHSLPVGDGDLEIVDVDRCEDRGPWMAAESTDLGSARRADSSCSAAEALIRLVDGGCDGEPVEPKYVEGPPVHRPAEP